MNNSKINLLTVAVIGLLLLNLATLSMMWMHHPGPPMLMPSEHGMPPLPPGAPPPPPPPVAFLSDQLAFSDAQQKQFEELRDAHHDAVSKLEDQNRVLRKSLFDLLKKDVVDSTKADSVASQIGETQKKIELLTFKHFNAVKNICTDNQKIKFDDILDDLMHLLKPPPPPQ